eukprot:3939235-Rhodomonas_salina.4
MTPPAAGEPLTCSPFFKLTRTLASAESFFAPGLPVWLSQASWRNARLSGRLANKKSSFLCPQAPGSLPPPSSGAGLTCNPAPEPSL